ncbi:MAG: response regulator [Planctomycetota bacterium]
MPYVDDILDARQAAKYLKINEQTIRRLAREKELPSFKVGGVWRFKRSSVDSWAESQIAARERKRILLVDDDKTFCDLIKHLLEQEGFIIDLAPSGSQALTAMRHNLPHAVLLDLKLPGMDGAQVLRQIREHWGNLPVVILTAYPDSDLVNDALKYSPITLLSKTASNEQIIDAAKLASGELRPAAR